ncbi:hypothetical protein F6W69_18880 [Microbacterium oxydans]|uniref:hypothetical protein n=2 Tax=Microbacterium oxydans TaxID=82380 RepID=UPI0011437949|nr:hypothetical protein [Microbacterium oxydans]KAB1888820.1 hypothetical protein F6W69_18880 [Microbacterium oxydans]GED40637.1 hypothetical protein MOX01_37790 [Microbacterium oxydans]
MVDGGLALPEAWDRVSLAAVGFEGFVRFGDLAGASVPREAGIYVALRTAITPPDMLELTRARAGSAYPLDDLAARWVPGTPVVYIGKAEAKVGGLRKRLGQYARKGSSHQGGRSIWQLADQDELLAAWALTPGESAEDVEIRYRAAFADVYGRWPFANRKR